MKVKSFFYVITFLLLSVFLALQVRKQRLTQCVSDLRQLYLWTYQFNNENPGAKSATINDVVNYLKVDSKDRRVANLISSEASGNLRFDNNGNNKEIAKWNIYYKNLVLMKDGTVVSK